MPVCIHTCMCCPWSPSTVEYRQTTSDESLDVPRCSVLSHRVNTALSAKLSQHIHVIDQSATVHQCADLHLVVFPSLSVEIYMQHIHAIHAASRLGDFELCWTLYLLYRWRLPSSVCFEQRNKDCNLCPWRTASVIRGCVRSLCYLCKCRLVKPVNTGVCGHTYRSVCCTHFSRCWHTVLCTPNHHHPMTTVITSSYQADWIETQFNRIK